MTSSIPSHDALTEASWFPWWAQAYRRYKDGIPDHRGKGRLLALLRGVGVRQGKPFIWRAKNGALIAISPLDLSVGWPCFEKGTWEPHVEACLRRLLKEGDVAIDVGANMGYFSAVMAQCVGSTGRVFAFEPVASTFRQLRLCQSLNEYAVLQPMQMALGAREGTLEIAFDPAFMGNASAYDRQSLSSGSSAAVELRMLDTLVADGTLPPPRLIKIDVEGYELDVLRGACRTLRDARPSIIFEVNSETAALAGWGFRDAAELLRSCAPYTFHFVARDGALEPIDPETYSVPENSYVDILATSNER
jgi:FkbM family methyltransferase